MKLVQTQLASCLSAAIRGRRVVLDAEVNLEELMVEANAHDIEGLVYAALKNQADFSDYRRDIILKSLTQATYYKQTLDIIKLLQEDGISVLLLKGAVLKSFYPQADLRMMGDVDVLVHEQDLGRVEELLTQMGYLKHEEVNEKHHVYEGLGFMIEVHWTLVNKSRQSGYQSFEDELWHHVQKVEIQGGAYQTLSQEDFLVHLLVHMANHFKTGGFGIRQLCDVTLWIEKHPSLDWSYIIDRLNEIKILMFSKYVLEVCYTLFKLKSVACMNEINVDQESLNIFMDALFSSGVHGKRERGNQFGNYFAYGKHKKYRSLIFLQSVFPSIRDLPIRYTYAHRHHWLLPMAWIHRVFRVIWHKQYTSKEKIHFLIHTPRIAKKKASLLQCLELVD